MVASVVFAQQTEAPQQKFSSFQEFQDFIKDSFINGSGIDEEIFNACVEFHEDVEWTDGMDAQTPIHEELGWYFTRFGRQCREPIYAAFFRNEDGSLWQAIVSLWDEEKQRPYRYLAPKGNGDRAFFPPIPPSIRQKISRRYRVHVPLKGSFWIWLQQNTYISRILTEGGKKSLSALSQGYVAISLYGCNCGREWEVGDILLTPDLEPFAQEYSKWLLALDRDTKPTAKRAVAGAKTKLAKALKGYGCDVTDLNWNPQQGKGLDDFLVNQGVNSFDHIYHSALIKLYYPEKNNLIPHPSIKNQEIDFNEIKLEYTKLLNANASKSEIQSFKIQTRQKYPLLQPSELNRLLEAVEDEFYQADKLENDAEELRKLIEVSEQTINLSDYLPPVLANPLTQYCEWQKIRHSVGLTILLTSISSLHKVGTELILHKNLNFSVPPTLYSAIVAESGSKKSPIFRAIAKIPLNRLRERAILEHQARVEEYVQELQAWELENSKLKKGQTPHSPKPSEPAAPTLFYFTDATGEGIKAQAQKFPEKALFALVDELAGYLSSQDKYFGGKGSDKQDLLSYYDGVGATVLRAGGIKVDVPQIYLSILGTIQPDILRKAMGNAKDVDGNWARILYAMQTNIPNILSDDVPSGIDCSDLLTSYFEKVFDLPKTTYRLSHEAFKLYQPFYNRLEQLRVSHSIPGLRAVYAKAEGQVGRLALNLHILHELAAGNSPSELIPLARMEQAIALMKFYIGQTKMIYASVDDGDSLAPHIQKVIELSKSKQRGGELGWIKASDIQKSTTASKRPSAADAREWMVQAYTLGYGVLRGEGSKLEFMSNPINEEGRGQKAEGRRNDSMGIQTPPNYKDSVDGRVLDPSSLQSQAEVKVTFPPAFVNNPPTVPINDNRQPRENGRQTIDGVSKVEPIAIQGIVRNIEGLNKIDVSENRYSPAPDNYQERQGAESRRQEGILTLTSTCDRTEQGYKTLPPFNCPSSPLPTASCLLNENLYTPSNPTINDLSVDSSAESSIDVQVDEHPHYQSGVGFGVRVENGSSIRLLKREKPYTASDTAINDLSIESPVESSIVDVQVDEQSHHKSGVGFGGSIDNRPEDVLVPPPINFQVGDRIEFQHELKPDWLKGEIIDIKTEKGFFAGMTVRYQEYNYKTKQRENREYVICREDWVRRR